jgi:hypothetical protein
VGDEALVLRYRVFIAHHAFAVWVLSSTLVACRSHGASSTDRAGKTTPAVEQPGWDRERGGRSADPPTAAIPTNGEAGAPVRSWDWTGIVGTGQSLAVGAQARTPSLTAQPFHNLKLSLGSADASTPPYDALDRALSVVPLVEPIRPEATSYPGAYPRNIFGETPHTAMADQISALYRRDTGGDYVTVHTVVGESGQGMIYLDKAALPTPGRGHAYAATLFEVSALARLAAAAGKTYGVGAIVLTHGETDGANAGYEGDMVRLSNDYNADITAITKQAAKIPLLVTQQQTCPGDNSAAASLIAQWRIGIDHPSDAVCVGPKYQYPYADDGLHLVAAGYDQLGEKYGEVYYETVVLGRKWQPLQPVSVGRSGRLITVGFHVPNPPLTWDDAMPSPHAEAHTAWSKGRGFEVQNDLGEQEIASVTIQGNSVLIALANDVDGNHLAVRYAVTQDGKGALGGKATGRVGQLRDSDPLVGYATGARHYNYAVSFAMTVN